MEEREIQGTRVTYFAKSNPFGIRISLNRTLYRLNSRKIFKNQSEKILCFTQVVKYKRNSSPIYMKLSPEVTETLGS